MEDVTRFKTLRLREYDYSLAGCYFVTICIKDRQNILWDTPVAANCVRPPQTAEPDSIQPPLSHIGKIVDNEIRILSGTYESIIVDKYVIMPNHVHMILTVASIDGNALSVSRAIKQFKGSVTKQTGWPIWQKSFYDHVIRDRDDYLKKWNYIDTNPSRLAEDEYFG